MPGFNRIKELVDAEEAGKTRYYTWRKSPSQVSVVGVWFDLSMSPGNPVPQYYIGAVGTSTALAQSTDGGLMHGANVSPSTKYLRMTTALATAATALPLSMTLCDYLMFYSFIDEGSTDEQTLVNSVSIPRYPTGEGVQIMAVSVAGGTGGQQFYVSYTNQSGVSGRTTMPVTMGTGQTNGCILSTDRAVAGTAGPFLPLQVGDTGVRSIQSVTMLGPDVGLFVLVLVKPLAQTMVRGIDAPVEKDYLLDSSNIPIIKDDAYLNFICFPQGTLAATAIHGDIKVVWT